MNSSMFSVIKPPLLHTISGPMRHCSAYIGRSSIRISGAGQRNGVVNPALPSYSVVWFRENLLLSNSRH